MSAVKVVHDSSKENAAPCAQQRKKRTSRTSINNKRALTVDALASVLGGTPNGLHTPPNSQTLVKQPPKTAPVKQQQPSTKAPATARKTKETTKVLPATEPVKKRTRKRKTKARPSETLPQPPECADSDSDDPLLIKVALKSRQAGRSRTRSLSRYTSREPPVSYRGSPSVEPVLEVLRTFRDESEAAPASNEPEPDYGGWDGPEPELDYMPLNDPDSSPVGSPVRPSIGTQLPQMPLTPPATQEHPEAHAENLGDGGAPTEEGEDEVDSDIEVVPLKDCADDVPPSPFAWLAVKRPPSPHPNLKRKPRRSTTPLDPALLSDADATSEDDVDVRLTYAQKEKWVPPRHESPASESRETIVPPSPLSQADRDTSETTAEAPMEVSPARTVQRSSPLHRSTPAKYASSKIPTPNRDVAMSSPSPARASQPDRSSASPSAQRSQSRIPVLAASPFSSRQRSEPVEVELHRSPRALLASQFRAMSARSQTPASTPAASHRRSRSGTPRLFDASGNALVAVSSADPDTAQRAAAILTKYHRYVRDGDAAAAPVPTPLPLPPKEANWGKDDWKRLEKVVENETKRLHGIGMIDERRVVRAYFELDKEHEPEGDWSELKVRLRARALLANRGLRRTTPQSAPAVSKAQSTAADVGEDVGDDEASSSEDDDDEERDREDDTFFERGPNYRVPPPRAAPAKPTLPPCSLRPVALRECTPPVSSRPRPSEPPSSLRRAISYLKSFIPQSPVARRQSPLKPEWTQVKLRHVDHLLDGTETPIANFADTSKPFETRLTRSLPVSFRSNKKEGTGRVREQAGLFEKLVKEKIASGSLKRSASEAGLSSSLYTAKLAARASL